MHVVIGLLGLVAVLAATVATEGSHAFTGFLHRPALLLLVLAPPFVALTSYRPEELWETARAVLRAIRRSPSRARAALYGDLSRFAADHRRGRRDRADRGGGRVLPVVVAQAQRGRADLAGARGAGDGPGGDHPGPHRALARPLQFHPAGPLHGAGAALHLVRIGACERP